MLVTLWGIVIDVSPRQLANKESATLVVPSCITTLLIVAYASGNVCDNLVTHDGIATDVSPLQYQNALSPILITLDGIVTDVSLLQPLNA